MLQGSSKHTWMKMLHRWQTYLRFSTDVNMMGSIFHTGFNHWLTEEPVLYTQTTLSFYFKSYFFSCLKYKHEWQWDAKWHWKPTSHSDVAVNTITTIVSCKSVVLVVWLKAPLFVCLLATGVHGVRTHVAVWYTYRPNTIKDYHSLFAHGCQWVWLCNICHNDIHLWPELGFTCMWTNRHTAHF